MEQVSLVMAGAQFGITVVLFPLKPVTAESLRAVTEEKFPVTGRDAQYAHHAVFFDAVRTRKAVVEDPIFGLRAAAPAVLANTSYFENRPVKWDPVKMICL